jgi:hypothetical protein
MKMYMELLENKSLKMEPKVCVTLNFGNDNEKKKYQAIKHISKTDYKKYFID